MEEGANQNTSPETTTGKLKPGDTISPRNTDSSPPPTETAANVASSAETAPMPQSNATVQSDPPRPPAPVFTQSVEQAPSMVQPRAVAVPPEGPEGSISWTASEFIAHNKSPNWYIRLSATAVVLALLTLLLTKDKISAAVILIGAVLFGVYAARAPRQLMYQLDDRGLFISQKYYSFNEFRSFAIVPEGAFPSIVFLPLKRFALATTIHYDPADEPKIVALLSDRLPLEERQRDLIERLMWLIRF